MSKRLRVLGVVLALTGLAFMAAGGVAFAKVQSGFNSLNAFSESQGVTLSYNEDGQLTERGTVEGTEPIMEILTEDWGFPVVEEDLDPNDPIINTATEYMYQMATIVYHVTHGTQKVTITERVEYNGEVFEPGTYDVPIEGRYWTDFDRKHPLYGPARGMAWTGTAHGLIGELGVGAATHSSLQLGLGLAGAFGGFGAVFVLMGAGLFWASRKEN